MKRRFLHLEHARPERPSDAHPERSRFELGESTDPNGGDSAARVPTTTATARFAERPAFDAPAAEDVAARLPPEAIAPATTPTKARFAPEPPPIALAERARGSLPFRRCAECGVDSHRMATVCQHCHADLQTPGQRAFMEGVARAVEAEREREAEQSAAFAAAQAEQAQAIEQARRAYAEALAASSRRNTERQLSSDPFERAPSIGMALLQAVPAHHRRKVAIGVISGAVLLLLYGLRSKGMLGLIAPGIAGVLLALFLPPRWYRHGRWWW